MTAPITPEMVAAADAAELAYMDAHAGRLGDSGERLTVILRAALDVAVLTQPAPITPDERATMRERYEPGPMGSPERIDIERKASQGLTARVDVPRLLDALDTAETEVARLRAATSPAWDEGTVREAGAQALTAVYERYGDNYLPDEEEMVDAVLAVVRRHLPVRPDRETLIEAMSAALHITTDRIPGLNPGPTLSADTASVVVAADAVLSEWPGESRATVQAEALREFADTRGVNVGDDDDEWWRGYRQAQRECLHDASARADRIEKEK